MEKLNNCEFQEWKPTDRDFGEAHNLVCKDWEIILGKKKEEEYSSMDSLCSDMSILMSGRDRVIEFTKYTYTEFLARMADGSMKWFDVRNVPSYSDGFNGEYIDERLGAESFEITVYDRTNGTKTEYSCTPKETKKMSPYEEMNLSTLFPRDIDKRNDREFILSLVGFDLLPLSIASDELRNDKGFVMEILNNSQCAGINYAFVSADLKSDREVAMLALKKGVDFQDLPENLKNDEDIIRYAISCGAELKQVPERYKDDEEIVLTALGKQTAWIQINPNDHTALDAASLRLKKDRNFVMKAIKICPVCFREVTEYYRNDEEVARCAVKCNAFNYGYISDELKENAEIINMALKRTFRVLEYLPYSYRDDFSYLIERGKNNCFAFEFASDRIKDDEELMLKASECTNGFAFRYASKRLKNKKSFVVKSCKLGTRKRDIPDYFWSDPEVCEAIAQQKTTIVYIDDDLPLE